MYFNGNLLESLHIICTQKKRFCWSI